MPIPQPAHRYTHRHAPRRWEEGFALGNGACGAMFWGDGAPLRFTLDHANLWDLRVDRSFLQQPDYSYEGFRRLRAEGRDEQLAEVAELRQRRDNPLTPTKLSLGRAELQLGEAVEYDCALDLDQALVEGTLRTAQGRHSLCSFVHRRLNVLCLQVGAPPAEAELTVTPLAELCAEFAALRCPPPRLAREGDLRVLLQTVPEGPAAALVWNATGPDYFLALEVAPTAEQALAAAHASWAEASRQGFAALREEHVGLWRGFWAVSAVRLPEPDLERLWYQGLYLLGCSARRGCLPPGLQGVWAMDGVLPPWRGDYHTDMNVQETFWPAGASGHLDLLDCWVDHLRACLPHARAFTERFFATEGAFWPCAFLPYYTPLPGWGPVQFAWSNSGWLAWLVWLRWRYSLDKQWLRDTGYPLVEAIFSFYAANLEEGEDGRLHVPLSSSPEFHENDASAWAADPSIDLALICRTCDWLMELEEALGVEELSLAAREVRSRLTPYPLVRPPLAASGFGRERVLALWPGQPLDQSHRHPSHLMAIHPAMDLTIEGPSEQREIIDDSVEHFLELGQYRWAGHTYAQWVSFAACLGRAGMAYEALRQFADHWVTPTGLHCNRDQHNSGMSYFARRGDDPGPFTMEANCGIAMGICDMLLQGWNDRLRIFPAVPDHWQEVEFRDLLAEGAFRVSAARCGGLTVRVRAEATKARRLRLRDPFAGAQYTTEGPALQREGEDLVVDLQAGQAVTLTRVATPDSLA